MKTVTMVLVSILWLGAHVSSQGVTTDEHPSEDELLSALQRGEIDDLQYERLREILCLGDTELTAAALDDIADIDNLLRLFGLTRDDLLISPEPKRTRRPRPLARLTHRYYQKASVDAPSRYRMSLELYPTGHLTVSARVDRTYTGKERVAARGVRYGNTRSTVRELVVGSYSRRLGLGTVFGYRGRLFDPPDRLDFESLRYPDYGGSNGAYVHLAHNRWSLQVSGTALRDADYRLAGGALMLGRQTGETEFALLYGLNHLKRRLTGQNTTDSKPGVHVAHHYDRGSIAAEVVLQAGTRQGFGAVVLEGEHRNEQSTIRYDLWAYGRAFLDLTAGSRSGPLGHRDTLDATDFGFTTRRNGAHGGRLRTVYELGHGAGMHNDLLLHALNEDSLRAEYTTALEVATAAGLITRLEYRYRFTRRTGLSAADNTNESRCLAQIDFVRPNLKGRVYLACTSRDRQADYLSLLAKVRIDTRSLGRLEFGTGCADLNLTPVRNDYWSVYARSAQEIFTNVSWAVKLFHRYSRASADRHETTITLEMEGVL